MTIIRNIFTAFNIAPSVPQIGCMLPTPKIRAPKEKQHEAPDSYIEDERTVTFGFRSATAINQKDGASEHLTEYDKDELKARGLWGEEKTVKGRKNKRGIITNTANAKAKAAWYRGGTAAEIAKAVTLGDSWAEKRHAAFEAALQIEIGEK